MKRLQISTLIITIVSLTFVGACKKSETVTVTPELSTNYKNISNKDLYITKLETFDGTTTQNTTSNIDSCSIDDSYNFKTTNVVNITDLGKICNNTTISPWAFNNNEKELLLGDEKFDLLLNDGITLKVSQTYTDGGKTFTDTYTFTKK